VWGEWGKEGGGEGARIRGIGGRRKKGRRDNDKRKRRKREHQQYSSSDISFICNLTDLKRGQYGNRWKVEFALSYFA